MSALFTPRLRRRLLRHHVPLAGAAFLSSAALYVTRPFPDVISRLSFATAYPALALLAATFLIGPWQVLRRRANPVSTDLRRDVGIWAGITGIAHAAIGQCVHLRGRPWLYYVYGPQEHRHRFPVRHDLFGFSNYTGLAATLVLAALLATSNDWSLRRMGTPGWKSLQRWNYALFALAAAHTIGYLVIEKQKAQFDATIAGMLAVAVGVQLAGVWARRSR